MQVVNSSPLAWDGVEVGALRAPVLPAFWSEPCLSFFEGHFLARELE